LQSQLASFKCLEKKCLASGTKMMIEFKPRMWTSLGLSAIALVSVSACQPGEQGQIGATANATSKSGEGEGEGAKAAVATTPVPVAVGGETGEAGVSDAYGDVPETSRLGLRIAHVTGFLLIARKAYDAGQVDEASVLVSQGLLEVYTPNAAELDAGAPGFKKALDDVVAAIDAKKPKAEVEAAFKAAQDLANNTEAASNAAPQDIIAGMASISAGLYKGVIGPEGNDPIEYQHAQGAALSAKAVLDASKSKLSAKDGARTQTLSKDVDAMLALFPATTLPEQPSSVAAVTGAASRVQLALSGIR
jgi:hypothetical protein